VNNKPKYLIRSCCQDIDSDKYFKEYCNGITDDIKQAYLYTEKEMLENLEDDCHWLHDGNCVITQVYNYENWGKD